MGELRVFQTHKQVVAKKLHQTSGMVEFGPELSALCASSEAGEGRSSELTLGYCLFQVKRPRIAQSFLHPFPPFRPKARSHPP